MFLFLPALRAAATRKRRLRPAGPRCAGQLFFRDFFGGGLTGFGAAFDAGEGTGPYNPGGGPPKKATTADASDSARESRKTRVFMSARSSSLPRFASSTRTRFGTRLYRSTAGTHSRPARITCVRTGEKLCTGSPASRSAAMMPFASAVETPSDATRSLRLNETTGCSFTSRYAAYAGPVLP